LGLLCAEVERGRRLVLGGRRYLARRAVSVRVLLFDIKFAKLMDLSSHTDVWDLDNSDFEVWDEFLGYAMNKAFDYGIDASTVLDHVASTLSQNPTPAFTDSDRIADLLLTRLEIGDARQIPGGLFGLTFIGDRFKP